MQNRKTEVRNLKHESEHFILYSFDVLWWDKRVLKINPSSEFTFRIPDRRWVTTPMRLAWSTDHEHGSESRILLLLVQCKILNWNQTSKEEFWLTQPYFTFTANKTSCWKSKFSINNFIQHETLGKSSDDCNSIITVINKSVSVTEKSPSDTQFIQQPPNILSNNLLSDSDRRGKCLSKLFKQFKERGNC